MDPHMIASYAVSASGARHSCRFNVQAKSGLARAGTSLPHTLKQAETHAPSRPMTIFPNIKAREPATRLADTKRWNRFPLYLSLACGSGRGWPIGRVRVVGLLRIDGQ